MSATEITVIGNVVNSPSLNRTQSGSTVTNFRVAATERRYDSGTQGWVDGATFFVDVECWGELGGNVSHSVSKGDPVVVVGAIRTDEWESDQGKRSRPQIRAEAVAPNLARGVADFRRTQRSTAAVSGEQEPPADVPAEDQPADDQAVDGPTSGDYDSGSRGLYEVNSEDSSREPAHV
jgi:single-strand DNA-binding protein